MSDEFDYEHDEVFEGGDNNNDMYLDHLISDDVREDGTLKDDLMDEELDMTNIEQEVHLIKVPDYVYQALFEDEEERETAVLKKFNQLISAKDDPVVTDLMLHLPEEFVTIPRDYTIKETKSNIENTYLFEEYGNRVGKRIVGKVTKESIMKPLINDPRYRVILRKRIIEDGDKRETIKFDNTGKNNNLDYLRPKAYQNTPSSFGVHGKRAKTSPEHKASRIPDKELRDLLFNCFAQFKYWTFNALSKKTNQPQAHLKNILSQIASLHRRGTYFTLYELKPAFAQEPDFQDADDNPNNNPYNDGKFNTNQADQQNLDVDDEDEEDENFEEID
ncbi:hypothetical protein K502DRAFT_309533 [Neoconidiobolus thromboides FSU 785]|nr:hypothetical protein K502DRAFT_309533 [Neoconidiobolus thromboides FSU 785]